jgi:hypothetical protein
VARRKKEGFPCQTVEGLNITVGMSIGASVTENNAAKYLGRFGVVPITGDRTNPAIIFNSAYYSCRLQDVMDDVGRKKVQTLVCAEITARTFDRANAEANKIIETVLSKASEYFASVGITLDFLGWADTFTFDHDVQDAVNRRYIAGQDKEIAAVLAPHADTIQKLAAASALRSFGIHSDGKLLTTIVGLPPDLGGLLGSLLNTRAPPPHPAPPVRRSGRFDKLFHPVTLREQQRAQVGVIDSGARLGRDDGLGVVGNAQPSLPQHIQVIRAIAHRQRGLELHTAFGGEVAQCVQLGGAVQDGFGHGSEQRTVGVQ